MNSTASVRLQGVMLGNKEMVSPQLWDRLTNRIQVDFGCTMEQSEQIMDQALAFLRLVAENPGNGYSPSPEVDKGWHTFILYTREYAEFCAQHAGQFIHHQPSDEEGVEYDGGGIARTLAAMKVRNIPVVDPLWDSAAQCGTYCSDSSGGGGQDNGNGG